MLMSSSLIHVIRVYRGWGYKEKHSEVWNSFNSFQFFSILAFPEIYFYCILINEGTNDSQTFRYFLRQLIRLRRSQF